MPVYCEILQIVIPKRILQQKYLGGIDQFKKDYQWGKEVDHEDEELISIASMDNSFKPPKGLLFDEKNNSSNDFVLVARYSSPALSWNVDWCESNKVYIWHKDCKLSSYKKMIQLSNMTMDKIDSFVEKNGKLPFSDIW